MGLPVTPHRRQVEELLERLEKAGEALEKAYTDEDIEEVPKPVERYFENVLVRGQPYIGEARLSLEGEFRTSRESDWKKLGADQRFTASPRGFVWDARIRMFPLLPVNVVDAYVEGKSFLDAKMLGVIPVARERGEKLDEAELMRFLAEAVWMPTALLPGSGVEWESIDADSARATIRDRGTTASLVFRFRDGKVKTVSGQRYRSTGNGFEKTRWRGHFSDYMDVDGVRVPGRSRVEWLPEDGKYDYWRGRVESIDHTY